jgi:hypothetical protein
MYFRVLKLTVILSIFQCFFYIKKNPNFWNAALYDVIDDVRALVPGLVHCKAWISFK